MTDHHAWPRPRLALAALAWICTTGLALAQTGLIGPTFTITTGGSQRPDAAYDPVNDVYLVVVGNSQVKARWVGSDGTPLGTAKFTLNQTTAWVGYPSVAWGDGLYLVAWQDTRINPTQSQIWGRILTFQPGGTPSYVTGDFQISANPSRSGNAAAIAYSPIAQEFLVVYQVAGVADIRARRISQTGALLGSEILITDDTAMQTEPTVAYNSTLNQYFVGWTDNAIVSIRGRRVAADGTLLGAAVTVDSAGYISIPQVQHDSSLHRYLMVWYTAAPAVIYGRLINDNGTFVGPRFPVASGYTSYDGLGLARNPVSGTYFSVFHGTTADDRGVEIDAAGVPGPVIFATSVAAGATGAFKPRVAANLESSQWLVVTSESYASTVGQRLESGGGGPVDPAPSVSAIAPATGPVEGGTAVTITGTNFKGGATVKIGGVAATGVAFFSATKITAVTPAGASGPADVMVTNPDGLSGTLVNGFTYTMGPAPAVTSIVPATGPDTGGTAVVISGANFETGATVTIGGTAATGVVVVSGTSITAFAPAHAAGVVDVTVTNPDGQPGTLAGGFTYTASSTALAVTGISPSSGPTTGGTPVIVMGTGFVAGAILRLGGVAATSVTVLNSTMISAVTKSRPAGVVPVVVTNPGGAAAVLAAGFTYTIGAPAAPTVTSVSPSSGATAGATLVTITGTNFVIGASVTFDGLPATGVVVVSGTTLTASTPAHAAATVDVVVTNPNGQSGTLAAGFTYSDSLDPTVTVVTPASGPTSGGTAITVTGTNFVAGAIVRLGGVAATSVVVVNSTTITAVTKSRPKGTVDVVVTNPSGKKGVLTAGFTYIAP